MAPLGYDPALVPGAPPDVRQRHRIRDLLGPGGATRIDRQPRAARTGELGSFGEVEVPRAQDVGPDTDMAEIGVVALERTFAGPIHARPQLDARVPVGQHPVAEAEFEIPEFLVAGIHEIRETVLQARPLDGAIDCRPRGALAWRNGTPTRKRLAIEDRYEAAVLRDARANRQRQQNRSEREDGEPRSHPLVRDRSVRHGHLPESVYCGWQSPGRGVLQTALRATAPRVSDTLGADLPWIARKHRLRVRRSPAASPVPNGS